MKLVSIIGLLCSYWLHHLTDYQVHCRTHANMCTAHQCISIGVQHFVDRPQRCGAGLDGGTGFEGINAFSRDFRPAIQAGDPEIRIYPILIDNQILRGWFHIVIDTSKVNMTLLSALVVTSQGGYESLTQLYPIGQFTLDLLDECDGATPIEEVTSLQLLPCHGTPARAAEHPNIFVFSKSFNQKFTETNQTEFHVNWKMPAQYGCNPIQYVSFRIGIGQREVNVHSQLATGYFHTGTLLTFDISTFYGVSDPKPIFLKPGSVKCAESQNELKNSTQYSNLSITDVNTNVSDLRPNHCFNHRNRRLDEILQTYVGRCDDEKPGFEVTKPGPGPENPLKCLDSNVSSPFKNLKSTEEYISDMRYDFCDCLRPEVEGLNETVTAEPASTAEPTYDLTPPDEDLDSGMEGFQSNDDILKSEDNEYFKHYENAKTEWRKRLWNSRVIHGTFASMPFFIFIPLAIFYSRYLKEAFNGTTVLEYNVFYVVHVVLIIIGFISLCFSEAASMVGVVYAGRAESAHRVVGFIVLGLYTICLILGPCRHLNYLVESIWIHVILGLAVYIFGLIAIIAAAFISSDVDNFTPLDSSFSRASVIILVLIRMVVDAGFHTYMTINSRKAEPGDEMQLNKNRMIFPTILKSETPPVNGTKFHMIVFIIYAVISVILCCVLIGMLIGSDSKGEKAIFEKSAVFRKVINNYGLH